MACFSFSLYLSYLLNNFLSILQDSASLLSLPFSYECSSTTTFTTNSTYDSNLNTVFHSLASNATNNSAGYYTAFAGNNHEDTVYGAFLCRGDLTTQACGDCVSTAVKSLSMVGCCPNRKVAVIWYDECMVRYSNESFFNKTDIDPAIPGWNPENITTNVTGFMETMERLVYVVLDEAVIDRPGKKFGVNTTAFASKPVYGLAQCTPDISSGDCHQCLEYAMFYLPTSNKGGRCVTPSCNVRYESYPFFNQLLLSSPPALSPNAKST